MKLISVQDAYSSGLQFEIKDPYFLPKPFFFPAQNSGQSLDSKKLSEFSWQEFYTVSEKHWHELIDNLDQIAQNLIVDFDLEKIFYSPKFGFVFEECYDKDPALTQYKNTQIPYYSKVNEAFVDIFSVFCPPESPSAEDLKKDLFYPNSETIVDKKRSIYNSYIRGFYYDSWTFLMQAYKKLSVFDQEEILLKFILEISGTGFTAEDGLS